MVRCRELLDNVGLILDAVHNLRGEQGLLLVAVANSYSLKQFKDMLICGREHVHPVNTAYFSISTLTEQAQWHGSSVDLVSPFMCNNSIVMNRTVNSIVMLFPEIARPPTSADELTVELLSVRRKVPKEMILVEPSHWGNVDGNSELR